MNGDILSNVAEIDLATSVVVDMDETQTWLSHPSGKDRQVLVEFINA